MNECEVSIDIDSGLLEQMQPILKGMGLTAEEVASSFFKYMVDHKELLNLVADGLNQNRYWASVKNAIPIDMASHIDQSSFCADSKSALDMIDKSGQPVVITADNHEKYIVIALKEKDC